MSQPSVTRMELLRVKDRKKLAKKGHDLLKKKRDTLIKEFFALIENYKELKKDTLEKLSKAFEVLRVSQGVSGVNRVKGLAMASKPSFELEASTKNLMGVKVPKFEIASKDSGWNASAIGTSYHVERARKLFVDLFPDMVKLAEIEAVVFKLAEEIKKTKRRVNSLEHIKIPEMEQTENYIKSQLSEMEREEFTKLKNVKKKLEEADH